MSRPTKPRIELLPNERWGDAERAALNAGFPGMDEVFLSGKPDAPPMPTVLGTLMKNPALIGPYLAFNRVILQTPALGERWREILVLRVAWRARQPYEWVQHARMAQEVGITKDEIRAVTRGPDAEGLKPIDAALVAAVDQLLDDYCIDDDTWARLAKELDERQLIELTFTVGCYTCLAMGFNSFGVQLDPGLAPDPTLPFPE